MSDDDSAALVALENATRGTATILADLSSVIVILEGSGRRDAAAVVVEAQRRLELYNHMLTATQAEHDRLAATADVLATDLDECARSRSNAIAEVERLRVIVDLACAMSAAPYRGKVYADAEEEFDEAVAAEVAARG